MLGEASQLRQAVVEEVSQLVVERGKGGVAAGSGGRGGVREVEDRGRGAAVFILIHIV